MYQKSHSHTNNTDNNTTHYTKKTEHNRKLDNLFLKKKYKKKNPSPTFETAFKTCLLYTPAAPPEATTFFFLSLLRRVLLQ